MATVTLNENQVKRHVELLETMAQMLLKEAEILRTETQVVGESKVSKGKTKSEKRIEFEDKTRRVIANRCRDRMRKLATPEDQERYREYLKSQNIII